MILKSFLFGPLFVISVISSAQEKIDFTELCNVSTDKSPRAKGIVLELKIPCDWLEFDGDRPAVVKKFGYQVDTKYNTQMMCLVLINDVEGIGSNELPPLNIFSEANLKNNTPPGSQFISGRLIKVDGLNCGESIVKTDYPSANGLIYALSANYQIFYKGKIINITYGINSTNQSVCKDNFDKYLPLFKRMISKTILLNQWK